MRSATYVLLFCLFLSCILPTASSQSSGISPYHVTPSPRQVAWQELEFTVFLHFGINTFTDREWGRRGEDPSLFNPPDLDCRQWVRTAKNAGAGLMIMVAKHHDGFCLWPSKYTDFSVESSPWKNGRGDVMAEMANACREEGMKLGIYLSPWDMNCPLYGTDEYNIYFKNQLRELLTRYGEIWEVWFDGACGEGPNGKRQVYDWEGYYAVVRELQPQAVIAITGPDVRWVGNESGDGNETQWSVVEDSLGLRWYPTEVDVSIRPGWFYHSSQDTLVKTPEELVEIYYRSVGRNSVLLLNIPPDARGLIHENDVVSLRGMKDLLDATFQNNLTENAIVKPLREELAGSVACDLGEPVTFDRLVVQEDFRNGQKVASFCFEALIDDEWKEVCKGTTIGYKRILRFDPVTAGKVRLRITESGDKAKIVFLGLYLGPEGKP